MPAWANGFLTNKKSLRQPVDNENLVSQEIQGSDIIVFHRPETSKFLDLAKMCKNDGKKIVMDNDDTFFIDGKHPLAELSSEGKSLNLKDRQDSIIEFLKIADLVTCSTETLAKEYREHSENVVVLPNCVDPDDWDEDIKRNKSSKVRIGIVGSAAMEYDYLHIKDIIRKLSQRDDVEIVMFGLGSRKHRENNPLVTKTFTDEYTFWDSITFDHFPWCQIEDYMATLNGARLDMMLIPRQENYFNKCKSNVKFLEASMCEIPVIAQSFEDGPYEEIPSDCGILIKDNKDWEEKIELLIKSKVLRRSMGKKAREYVLNNYNIAGKAHLWESAYKSI
jgi:glycosyltransferase involved in cell wall biosynthesis